MLSLLAIVLVAFLASIQSETVTTRAYTNVARARQAADAGVELAMGRMRQLFEAYPDAATFWATVSDADGEPLVGATLFYEHAGGRYHPLFSGAPVDGASGLAVALALPEAALPFGDARNSVDVNAARYPADRYGWIGSPAGGRVERRVPWVEMRGPDGKVTGRFAFWMEDESFRLPLHELGVMPRGTGDGLSPAEVPMQPALLAMGRQESEAAAIADLRARSPGGQLTGLRALNHLDPAGTLGEQGRFYFSLHASSANLSRAGALRLNVNEVVKPSLVAGEIRTQLDRLIAPLDAQIPDFGERFYPATVTPAHQAIYLEKLAANLRDYLDDDSQPTVVLADRSVMIDSPPTGAFGPPGNPVQGEEHGGDNPVIAIGKENVPLLQEYACRIRLTKFTPNKGGAQVTAAAYDFFLDYYFEFWNMGTRDLSVANGDLGPSPFLAVHNQPGFDTGGGTKIAPGRSFSVPLPNTLVFPAGRVTVLTTDSNPLPELLADASRVVKLSVPESARRYKGTTYLKVSSNHFRVNLLPRHTLRTDYGTAVVLGNENGWVGGFAGLPLSRGDSPGNLALSLHNDDEGDAQKDTIANPKKFFMRGGSLRGTSATAQTGDPRTNDEQLYLRLYSPDDDVDQTRYYSSELGNDKIPALSSLGAFNSNFVDTTLWPDPFPSTPTGVNAPAVVADAPMRSIGELGHLFDPMRGVGTSGNHLYSRGGGRTLTIGQPDPVWDGDPRSRSRERTAWRWCDLYATTSAVNLSGRLNPNGALRDGGVGFRSLLSGLVYSSGPMGEGVLAGEAFPAAGEERLVGRLLDRLAKGPLLERGELSELLGFHADFAPTGVDPSALHDRGREELFRRLVELVEMRGQVFSVWVIGQGITETPSGEKRVRSTQRRRVTFALEPQWTPPLDPEFDPGDRDEIAARFRKPDRWQVRVLEVGG